jgi:hypothetical protein
MRMPASWLEWLGVVSSILTIIWFGLYLRERCKRKNHNTLMVEFRHGMKPLVESMSTTGAVWQHLLS